MFQYLKNKMGIKEKVELENAQRDALQLKSEVDYIAMMTDVDLMSENEEVMPHEPEIQEG